MRVIALLRPLPRDDRGVAAALTVVAMSALLGMAAVVVDIGNAWQARRHVITSTDAAALAAARDIVQAGATPGLDCDATSQDYVTRNNPNATWLDCDSSNTGYVTVEAEADVDYIFGPILGLTGTTVESETTVSFKNVTTVDGGLRPFGLCGAYLFSLDSANRVPADPPGTPMTIGDGFVYRFEYAKATPSPCAGGDNIPGNWGAMDFDGGSNSNSEIKDWVENGYKGPPSVSIGDDIEGNTGNTVTNSLKDELDFLMTVDKFTLPVFDVATDNGANAQFTISNFVVVKLHDWKPGGNDPYLDLQFLYDTVDGSSNGTPPTNLGAYVIGICAVDNVDVAANCG